MKPEFKDFPLSLINPGFDSDLVDVLNELEILRHLQLRGDVHPYIFMQLKSIFHMLESIGSARIEGNHTTIADYVESKLDNTQQSEQLDEIQNIEKAMQYIDEAIQQGSPITEHFIRELHSLTVNGLSIGREGDKTPGQYRTIPVVIAQSALAPPARRAAPEPPYRPRADTQHLGRLKNRLAGRTSGSILTDKSGANTVAAKTFHITPRRRCRQTGTTKQKSRIMYQNLISTRLAAVFAFRKK